MKNVLRQSKFLRCGNVLLSGLGVNTYAVHPGLVATEAARYASQSFFSGAQWLFDNVLVYFIKSPEQGAQTTIHCAVSNEAGTETGLYYRYVCAAWQ
jgi:hypothetical protein